MSLTSDGKRMLDWAQKNNSPEERRAVFAPIDDSVTSYYEKRGEQESLISSVSAMKHKPAGEKEEAGLEVLASTVPDEDFEIPEYVYIF